MMGDVIVFEVISGVEGRCLAVTDKKGVCLHRIAGPKPWGGGKTVCSFEVSRDELMKQLGMTELSAKMEAEG